MTTATLLPLPRACFFDANGNPLASGLVYTYIANTTTPKQTWQDSGETTLNTNPIVLDANGSCLLYGSGSYTLAVTDALGNSIPAYSGLTADTLGQIISLLAVFSPAVANISALRAATTSTLTQSQCYVLGYTSAADGGGGEFMYIASDVTSTDNGGTIIVDASNRRWYRDTQGLAYSVKWFGAFGDGVTDDTSSVQATFTAMGTSGGAVYFPKGNYKLASQITYTISSHPCTVKVFGEGQNTSLLSWAAGGGLLLSTQNQFNSVTVQDLGFLTGVAGGSGTGLSIANSNAASNTGNSALSTVERCTFRGTDEYQGTFYWGTAISIVGVSLVNFIGCLTEAPNGSGNGLVISGNASNLPVIFNATSCVWNGGNIAITYGDRVQGVTISQCNMNGNNYGVFANTSENGLDQLSISNSQIATLHAGINTLTGSSISNIIIQGNLISTSATSGFGLICALTGVIVITGNSFTGILSADTGVNIDSASLGGVISNNEFFNLVTPIFLGASTSNVSVQNNLYKTCTNTVLNSGTGNLIGFPAALQIVTGSRALSTNYVNTNPGPLFVSVTVTSTTAGSLSGTVNSTDVTAVSVPNSSLASVFWIVPPGQNYGAVYTVGSATLSLWQEWF